MAVNITNFGFINYKDNHREYNIHTTGNNIADIIRQCEAEDIQAEEIATKQEQPTKGLCPYIQVDRLNEMGVYTPEQFNQLLSEKTQMPAPDLAAFLRKHEKSGYLNYGTHNKRQVFDTLHAYYPDMKKYTYPNFCLYF